MKHDLNIKIYGLSIVLFLFSLFIRIEYFHHTEFDKPVRGDSVSYLTYTENLNAYGIFSKEKNSADPEPDSYWSPGYPVFLLVSGRLAKSLNLDSFSTVLYTQAIIGAMTCLICFLLGNQFLNIWLAFSAGLLTAISPHLISIGSYILTELLFSFLLISSLYAYILLIKYKTLLLALITGLMFGLSCLVNPVIFFAPFLLVIIHSLINREDKFFSQYKVVLILIFSVVVGAWSLRGYLNVSPDKASSSDRILTNLIIGSHSNFFEVWRENPRNPDNPATLDNKLVDGDMVEFLPILGKRILDKPIHYLKWYFIDKPLLLWDWDILIGQGDIYVYPVFKSLYHKSNLAAFSHAFMKSAHFYLFGIALLGVLFCMRKEKAKLEAPISLYLVIIYVSSVYVALQSEPRYSIPLRPEMYLCAMFFISKAHSTLKGLQNKKIS